MSDQGYPVQQYTNLDNDIVLSVASDGTITLINGTIMASGTGSPEGVITAPPGSWYVQTDGVSPNFWFQKQVGTGNTGWASIGGGVANIVTSVFGRFGDVVAEANDYSSVDNLLLGDSSGSNIQFATASGAIELTDAAGDDINIGNVGGGPGIHIDVVSGDLNVVLNGNSFLVDGKQVVTDGGAITDLQITDGVSQGLVFNSGVGSGTISLADGTGDNSISLDGTDTVQIASPHIILLSTTGSVQLNGLTTNVQNLQVFANNAAAITGGLNAGDLYRNGANPDVVCIVH